MCCGGGGDTSAPVRCVCVWPSCEWAALAPTVAAAAAWLACAGGVGGGWVDASAHQHQAAPHRRKPTGSFSKSPPTHPPTHPHNHTGSSSSSMVGAVGVGRQVHQPPGSSAALVRTPPSHHPHHPTHLHPTHPPTHPKRSRPWWSAPSWPYTSWCSAFALGPFPCGPSWGSGGGKGSWRKPMPSRTNGERTPSTTGTGPRWVGGCVGG